MTVKKDEGRKDREELKGVNVSAYRGREGPAL